MTLSKPVSRWLHTAVVGFITGVLAYTSSIIVGAPIPGWRALILALVTSGTSRMAGALLAKIQTPEADP